MFRTTIFFLLIFIVFYVVTNYGSGVDYFKNKNDAFIKNYISRIGDRDSLIFELNYLRSNKSIKEQICSELDLESENLIPFACWKDKDKFEELITESAKSKRLRLISEVENILTRQSKRDLDKLPLYVQSRSSFVTIEKNEIKKGTYFLVTAQDNDDRPYHYLTKSNLHHYQKLAGLENRMRNKIRKENRYDKLFKIRTRIRKEQYYEKTDDRRNNITQKDFNPAFKRIYRDSFSETDREKYQLACSEFHPLSIDLCYHEVYYVELELRKIQILKLVNKPIKDHEFPISIYEERELNPIEKKSPFEKELELDLIQAKEDLKSP